VVATNAGPANAVTLNDTSRSGAAGERIHTSRVSKPDQSTGLAVGFRSGPIENAGEDPSRISACIIPVPSIGCQE